MVSVLMHPESILRWGASDLGPALEPMYPMAHPTPLASPGHHQDLRARYSKLREPRTPGVQRVEAGYPCGIRNAAQACLPSVGVSQMPQPIACRLLGRPYAAYLPPVHPLGRRHHPLPKLLSTCAAAGCLGGHDSMTPGPP